MIRGQPIDYTNLGYDALRESMLAIARETLPEWTDQSENDLGVLLIELFAYASDITLYYQSRIAAQLFPATSDEPESLVQLLRLLGYELRPPAPATVDLAVAVEAGTTTAITIPDRTAFLTTLPSGEQLRFENLAALTIDPARLGPADDANLRWFLPVPVVEGRTVTAEQAGVADGGANQRYQLRQKPVIAGSITVTVNQPGVGASVWQEAPALTEAGPDEQKFVVQRDAEGGAAVLFGDGVNGKIPPRGGSGTNQTTVLADYRVGGGPSGNVPPGATFTTSVPTVRLAVAPAGGSGGEVAEDIEAARARAPRLFRTQNRAVTADDYVEIALRTPGVGKARAESTGWNDVVLYVAPSGTVEAPSELLRTTLLTAFEPVRMLTTTLTVRGPQPVPVYVRATVRAQPYYLRDDVTAAATAAIGGLLAFDAVDFGQPLYLSRFYDAVQSLPQVSSLTIEHFSRTQLGDVNVVEPDGVLELAPFELAKVGAVALTVTGGVTA